MFSENYFRTQSMSVGYGRKVIISDINIDIKKGEILTLIGPNGSGKSTILKSITKQLSMISGVAYIDEKSIMDMSNKEMSVKMSVVLTERIQPELMSCSDIVASGRYPYTNYFGKITETDRNIINQALAKVNAQDLANCDFNEISDGQKQRIMLARAICQEPEIIVLDEPTSFLDIRHKIELLDILRTMSREKGITIIMSLHEIDLASKISDKVMCVRGDTITRYGAPDDIFTEDIIDNLYDIKEGSYNMVFGSVELSRPEGNPQIMVVAGGGKGANIYRNLQKHGKAFITGILFDNDIDYCVAKSLAAKVIVQEAFTPITDSTYEHAVEQLDSIKVMFDAGTPIGEFNQINMKLIEEAKKRNIPVFNNIEEAMEFLDD